MANSVDRDQTATIGAVCSGSTLFASILNSSDDFSRRHFQVHFFLGALRVNIMCISRHVVGFGVVQLGLQCLLLKSKPTHITNTSDKGNLNIVLKKQAFAV